MQLITDYESDFLGELNLRIEYDYQPEEAMQPNPDHHLFGPGCAEEATINSVEALIKGEYVQVMEHITEDHLDVLADLCLEDMNDVGL